MASSSSNTRRRHADETPTQLYTSANRNRKHCWAVRLLLVVGISAFRSHIAHCCQFPVFMQTNGTMSRDRSQPMIGRYQQPIVDDNQLPTSRDWRARIIDQHTDAAGQHVTVFGDVMTVMAVSSDKSLSSHSLRCIEAIGDDRFLVSQIDEGASLSSDPDVVDHVTGGTTQIHYTCVQFVRRASDVVQLRLGLPADRPARDLCSYDVIKLDPWLLIDRNYATSGQRTPVGVPCALRGGFGVRMYDRTGHQGACDSRRGETRMESDCERFGDGMHFQFRHASCVPVGLYMYATQRTVCVANWVTGSFAFILLRHDRLRYAWLLRYPSSLEESFTAHLFVDLVADVGERISETSNYIRLDTVRDTPRPATSLCVDEHDVCATWRRPCTSGPQMALACPRTCGVCNASRPSICELPPEVIGTWYDGSVVVGSETTIAEIGRTTLTLKPEAGSRLGTLRCIRWRPPVDQSTPPSSGAGSPPSRFRYVVEEMLVTETVDGCRPRYVCVRIMRKSASVVYFRLSAARQWPLTSSPVDPIDCRSFSYDHDSPSEDPVDRYSSTPDDDDVVQSRAEVGGRGRHGFRLLVSREPRGAPVACRLPVGQLNNYSVTFRCATDTVVDCVGCSTAGGCGGGGPADCLGSLSESESGTSLRLTLTGCSHQTTNRTEYQFDCRQSSRIVPSKDLVIVVSSTLTTTNYSGQPATSTRTVYHCWVFPNGSPPALGVFYLFEGSRCDDAMRLIDFTEAIRIDGGGFPKSSSSSSSLLLSSVSSSTLSSSPSSLALATFLSKPRRSPREEEDLASVSVASGSRTVHAMSVPQRNAASGHSTDISGQSLTTARSARSTTGATGLADQTSMTGNSMVGVVLLAVLVVGLARSTASG